MKNLKKGLAVAMSLAMVATVVPAMNTTVVNATCDVDAAQTGVAFIDDNKAAIDIDTINVFDGSATAIGGALGDLQGIVECSGIFGAEYVTIAKKLIAVFTSTAADNKVFEYEKAVMDLIGLVGEQDDELVFELSTSDAKTGETTVPTLSFALQTTASESDIKLADDGTNAQGITTPGDYTNAVRVQTILENEFAGNITDSLQAVVTKYKGVLDDYITEYKEDHLDATVAAYVKGINAIEPDFAAPNSSKTVADLLDGTTDIPYNDLAKVKKVITDIKANKASLPSKYAEMEDEPEVVEIMDALDAVVEAMTDIQTFAKAYTKDADYKGYTPAIKTTVGKIVALASDKVVAGMSASENGAGLVKADTTLTTAEIKAVQTFVENMTNEFFEVEKTERTNGTYRVTLKGNENARFLGTTITSAIKPADIVKLLTQLVDKEEGTTYYDELLAINTNVDKAIKAITTDLKGITTSNLSASNVNKVIAADKAYGVLTGNTISSYYSGSANGWEDIPELGGDTDSKGYTFNLTSAQAKAVKGQVATLKNLVAKMYALGLEDTELKTGWIDLGNGNWDFFNEDGTVATKWVAAGKDWYYVKASHMLRNSWVAQDASGKVWYYVDNAGKMVTNTTVDGYVINANGEWHK